jgi:hypothetical protein
VYPVGKDCADHSPTKEHTTMKENNIIALNKQAETDPLQSILRDGARKMLATAIEAEVEEFMHQHRSIHTQGNKAAAGSRYCLRRPRRPAYVPLRHTVVYSVLATQYSLK